MYVLPTIAEATGTVYLMMVRCRIVKPSFRAKLWIVFSTLLLTYFFTSVFAPPPAALLATVPSNSVGATPTA